MLYFYILRWSVHSTLPHKLINDMEDPVLIVGFCDIIRGFTDQRLGIGHGDT